ncbi:hypothetical protein DFH28DRAFT_184818 [Melampsora americana]|nr:hypothetical protein DFH28DRAFT_184818 [Melampsora americana]
MNLPRMMTQSDSDPIKSTSSCHPFSVGFGFDERVQFQDSGFQLGHPSDSILGESDQAQRRNLHSKRNSGGTATTTNTTTSGSEESGDHFFESQDDSLMNDHNTKNSKLTSEKRKAQNRAAQRNFRERKDRELKENAETLVIRTEENKQMCSLIETLEAENHFLRQNIPASVLAQLAVALPARTGLASTGLTAMGLRRDVSQGRRLKSASLR